MPDMTSSNRIGGLDASWLTGEILPEAVSLQPGRGWLYRPRRLTEGDAPAVVLAGGPPDDILRFARYFAQAGLVALAFDNGRGGVGPAALRLVSGGEPSADYAAALAWIGRQHGVDPTRLGVWGAGQAGGEVLALTPGDPGVRAAVSLAPVLPDAPASGPMPPAGLGEAVTDAAAAGTAVLMLVAADDDVLRPEEQVGAYRRLAHPKRLRVFDGGHRSFQDRNFDTAARAASVWFSEHLGDGAEGQARLDLFEAMF